MNSHNFIILIIFTEDRTSTDSFGYWYVKDQVIFVNVDLPVILSQLPCYRVAKYSYVVDGFLKLISCLEKVITKTAEVFFQVLLGIKLQYCKVEEKSWIFVVFFIFRHFFVLLSWVYFDYFEAVAIALINRGRDKVEIRNWAKVHRIAVMSYSENEFRGYEASCAKSYKFAVDENFDDPHCWVGIFIGLQNFDWLLVSNVTNICSLCSDDSVELL